jgi:hypothetical protein
MRRFLYLVVVVAMAILVWFFGQPEEIIQPSAIVQQITAGAQFSVGPPGATDTPRSCAGDEAFITLDKVAVVDTPLTVNIEPAGIVEVVDLMVPKGTQRIPLRVKGLSLGEAHISIRTNTQRCTAATCPSIKVAVIGGRGCSVCEPERAPPPIKPTAAANVCDRSRYYVDAHTSSATPCDAFPRALSAAFTKKTAQQASIEEVLCAWGAPECSQPCGSADAPPAFNPAYKVAVIPSRVLPEGDTGADRFWRVSIDITGPRGYERRVEVPEAYVCDMVDRLRNAVGAAQGECSPSEGSLLCKPSAEFNFNVGLECPVTPTQISAHATDSMKTWHTRRLQDGPAPTAQPVGDVLTWLLDTGLDDDARNTNTTVETFSDAFPDPVKDKTRSYHGAAMAHLIRQADPTSTIRSVRVFAKQGDARTGTLALALHKILEAAKTNNQANLINLSLGWPAEFSQPSVITGRRRRFRQGQWTDVACRTTNDGVGESVRYVLQRMAQSDAAGEARIAPIAAGGNLPPVGVDLKERSDALAGFSCGEAPQLDPSSLLSLLEPLVIYAPEVQDQPWQVSARIGRFNGDNVVSVISRRLTEVVDRLNRSGASTPAELREALQPLTVDRALSASLLEAQGMPTAWCRGDVPVAPRPFLPAGWGIGTAHNGALLGAPLLKLGNKCAYTPLVTAVGAIDVRDRLTFHHDGSGAPPIAAPGMHVFVNAKAHFQPLPQQAAHCTNLAPVTDADAFPMSGTSLSAALATGLAGTLQRSISASAATALGAPGAKAGLDAARLGRLLAVTGEPVTMPVAGADATHRLSACRAHAVLSANCLGSLPPGVTPIGGAFPAACASAVATCAGDPQGDAAWPAGYPQPTCTPTSSAPTPTQSLNCTDQTCLTAFEAGILGPQPPDPVCTVCGLDVFWEKVGDDWLARGTAYIELGTLFPWSDYKVTAMDIYAKAAGTKQYFKVATATDRLYAGWNTTVKGIKLSPITNEHAKWEAATAYVVVKITNRKTGYKQTLLDEMALKVGPKKP